MEYSGLLGNKMQGMRSDVTKDSPSSEDTPGGDCYLEFANFLRQDVCGERLSRRGLTEWGTM